MTEASVLEAIDRVTSILAPRFVYGYHSVDDIKQDGVVLCLEVLATEKYDPTRPLPNFLYRHVRNRLLNNIRNKFRRNDPPCPRCHSGDNCGDYNEPCDKYVLWKERNDRKASLMKPLDIAYISDEKEKNTRDECDVSMNAEVHELLGLIDEKLPADLRSVYLQMRAKVSVPKSKRLQVERAVRQIVRGAIECPSEDD